VTNLVALLAALVLLYRAVEWPGAWLPAYLVLVTGLLRSAPFAENLSRGQIYLWVLASVALAAYGAATRRDALAGLGLAAAMLLKIAGLPLWLLMMVERRRRTLAWGAGTAIGFVLATLPRVGVDTYVRWIADVVPAWVTSPAITLPAYQTVGALLQRAFRYDPRFNPSPLADLPIVATCLAAAVSLAMLAVTLAARRASSSSSSTLATFGAMAMLGVVLQPAAEQYQYLVAFVPLVIATRAWLRRPDVIAGVCLAAAAMLIFASLPYKDPALWIGARTLLAYPRLYGGLILWVVLVYESRREIYSTTATASIENKRPFGSATTGPDRTGGESGKNSAKSSFKVGKAAASAMKQVTLTTRCRLVPASSSTALRFWKA
jgi:hypothetical protein